MRIVFIASFLLFASKLAAAPVPVQTGEHDTFTRIVVTLPKNPEWRIGRNEYGYTVRMAVEEGYDTSNFFDIIPKTRVESIAQDISMGELLIGVSCDCRLSAFVESESFLVIDIQDGKPEPDSPFEIAIENFDAAPEVTAGDADRRLPPFSPNPLLPVVLSTTAKKEVTQTDIPQPQEPMEEPAKSTDLAGRSTENPTHSDQEKRQVSDLADFEETITQSLGRALSQGLLRADASNIEGDNNTLDLEEILSPGLQATTGIDQAAIPNNEIANSTQTGTSCAPEHFFDVAAWGDDRPFVEQISLARSNLTSAVDEPEEESIVELARTYIFFGFGREARLSLEIDGYSSLERQYLSAMAGIIDGDQFDTTIFALQASCQSSVSLWALLASNRGSVDARVETASILRTFNALPYGLKSHLAPMLSNRFIEIGDNDAAVQVMDVIKNHQEIPMEAELADATLKRSLGEVDAAVQQVVEIADRTSRPTPELMLRRMLDSKERNTPISPSDFVLIDALRFENASLPIASDLAELQIEAYLRQGLFSAAESLLSEQEEISSEIDQRNLRDEYVISATKKMDDAEFLEFAFENNIRGNSIEAVTSLSSRLLELGFPARAKSELEVLAPTDRDPVIVAQIELEMNNTEAALLAVEGEKGSAAEEIRQLAASLASLDGISPETPILSTETQKLWRRSDWNGLSGLDDQLLSAASIAALNTTSSTPNREAPLRSGRALLQESMEARSIVEGLLSRFESPVQR